MKFGMNHIHIKAEDPRSTAQWYVDTFGATIAGEAEMGGTSRFARTWGACG